VCQEVAAMLYTCLRLSVQKFSGDLSWMLGLIYDGIGHEFMIHEFMISLLDNRGAVVIVIMSHASTRKRVDGKLIGGRGCFGTMNTSIGINGAVQPVIFLKYPL